MSLLLSWTWQHKALQWVNAYPLRCPLHARARAFPSRRPAQVAYWCWHPRVCLHTSMCCALMPGWGHLAQTKCFVLMPLALFQNQLVHETTALLATNMRSATLWAWPELNDNTPTCTSYPIILLSFFVQERRSRRSAPALATQASAVKLGTVHPRGCTGVSSVSKPCLIPMHFSNNLHCQNEEWCPTRPTPAHSTLRWAAAHAAPPQLWCQLPPRRVQARVWDQNQSPTHPG